MNVGVIFPTTEIGADPTIIRDWAQACEAAGFHHILAFDHVIGADPINPTGSQAYMDHTTPFHEPLVLFAYLAGVTRRIEFTTGVLVLPQRQAVLVAKQVAELDILSGGRVRLGIGLGWNEMEFRALGADFQSRGRRVEEQIQVMRRLWSEPIVNFRGRDHVITAAGLAPLPTRPSIPIWMGAHADASLRRMARLADGWICPFRPDADGQAAIARVSRYVSETGRDPATFGIDGRINLSGDPARWQRRAAAWRAAGATHLSVATMGLGLEPGQHIDLLVKFAEATSLTNSRTAI
jgi:probable F420-dependent oxidoreductase